MLKKTIEQLVQENVALLPIEKQYALANGLDAQSIEEKTLSVTVLERLNKETEELIAEEGQSFLETPINYLKTNQEQFVYAEMTELDHIRTDAFAVEFDEVFQTYTAMFAVALQKKYKQDIQAHLLGNLDIEEYKSSVAFAEKEGVWEMNLALDSMNGFTDEMTFEEVYTLLYSFIFTLLEKIEKA